MRQQGQGAQAELQLLGVVHARKPSPKALCGWGLEFEFSDGVAHGAGGCSGRTTSVGIIPCAIHYSMPGSAPYAGKGSGLGPYSRRVAAPCSLASGRTHFLWKDTGMDLRISPMTSQGIGALGQAAMKRTGATGGGAEIADSFKNALKTVSSAQNEASRLQTQVQLGNPTVSLEETMLAMQKGPDRLPGHLACAQPHGAGLHRHHEHERVRLPRRASRDPLRGHAGGPAEPVPRQLARSRLVRNQLLP